MKLRVLNKFVEKKSIYSRKNIHSAGITLISLVITIIVLLILVGISVSMLIGDSGILNKAETAVEVTNNSIIKEEVELAVFEKITEYYSDYDNKIEMYATDIDYVKSQFIEEKII